jgi:hypothetical protein
VVIPKRSPAGSASLPAVRLEDLVAAGAAIEGCYVEAQRFVQALSFLLAVREFHTRANQIA